MQYKYDVFVSHRRLGDWPAWVQRYFLPGFKHWLGTELGAEARIFVDFDIPAGNSWPQTLATDLCLSMVLVPLWTPAYFSSDWCLKELAHMLAREQQYGLRRERPEGLIVPLALHDGTKFPSLARTIEWVSLEECTGLHMAEDSPKWEKLDATIKNWVPDVARAIKLAKRLAPKPERGWVDLAIDGFVRRLQVPKARQTELPRLL